MDDDDDELNRALHPFTLSSWKEYIDGCPPWIPVVSVGSGLGQAEYALERVCDREFILVDPTPHEWKGHIPRSKSPQRSTDYAYVLDLIARRPSVVKDCILMLKWPYPGNKYGSYDLDAIRHLRPRCILIHYERWGCAGTYGLHQWLSGFGETTLFQAADAPDPIHLPPLPDTYTKRGKRVVYLRGSRGEQKAECLLFLARKYLKVKKFQDVEVDLGGKDLPYHVDCTTQ
jgi:hypothetical protein